MFMLPAYFRFVLRLRARMVLNGSPQTFRRLVPTSQRRIARAFFHRHTHSVCVLFFVWTHRTHTRTRTNTRSVKIKKGSLKGKTQENILKQGGTDRMCTREGMSKEQGKRNIKMQLEESKTGYRKERRMMNWSGDERLDTKMFGKNLTVVTRVCVRPDQQNTAESVY